MKLYDLLRHVAETMSRGNETEWLYQYFLHTFIDYDGYIRTAEYWSDDPMPDREIPDLDKVLLCFNDGFQLGCTSFVTAKEGETKTKFVMYYESDDMDYIDRNTEAGLVHGFGESFIFFNVQAKIKGEWVLNEVGGLPVIDLFAQLSGLLTPITGSLFNFLSKSVMFADWTRCATQLNIDYSKTHVPVEVIVNTIIINCSRQILDAPDMEDLGVLSICFDTEYNNINSVDLDFYSSSYEVDLTIYDEYRYLYIIDLATKTFESYSGRV